MANKFAVPAGGNWDTDATWSTTSGGSPDTTKPTAADNVFLDASSGNVVLNGSPAARSLDCTGYTGTLSGSSTLTLGDGTEGAGNTIFKLSSGMTYTATSAISIVTTSSTVQSFTSAGKTLGNISLPGFVGASIPNILIADNLTAGVIAQNTGKIDATGRTLTIDSWVNGSATGKTLTITNATVNLTKATAGDIWKPDTNGVVEGTGSTIVITAASTGTRTFLGGGQTYGTLTYTVAGSTGTLDITGANTFETINFSDASNARSLRFTAGTTTTVTNFNVVGTASKLMTVSSITAATHTLSKASGTVSTNYLSLTNSIATGGATWYAGANSTDNGGNTGWIFSGPVTIAWANAETDLEKFSLAAKTNTNQHIQDMKRTVFASGTVNGNINDSEKNFMIAAGTLSATNYNDVLKAYMYARGVPSTLTNINDMLRYFYQNIGF